MIFVDIITQKVKKNTSNLLITNLLGTIGVYDNEVKQQIYDLETMCIQTYTMSI